MDRRGRKKKGGEDGRTGREDKNRGCKISRRGFFLGDFFRERAGRRETEGDWSRTKHRLFEGEIKRSKEDPHEDGDEGRRGRKEECR